MALPERGEFVECLTRALEDGDHAALGRTAWTGERDAAAPLHAGHPGPHASVPWANVTLSTTLPKRIHAQWKGRHKWISRARDQSTK
jgi:hypothetical protein